MIKQMRNRISNLFLLKHFLYILGFLLVFSVWGNTATAEDGSEQDIYFTILHTNDEHSSIIPHSPALDYVPGEDDSTTGGFARLASAIGEVRSEKEEAGEPVLLFNAGDFLGGGAFGWLAPHGVKRDPELAIMQKIGYDAVIIGNHEYDYGPDILADYLLSAGYPEAHNDTLILASNTRAPADHPLLKQDLYRQTGIMELENNLKVGVFGLIGNQAILVAANTGDVEFADQHQTAREAIQELKEEGADVIVALTHSGIGEDRELARSVDGIDVIVGGHCHTPLQKPIKEGNTLIVQAGSYVEYLGCLELAYNAATGQVRVRNEENERPYLTPIDATVSSGQEVTALIDEYLDELNGLVGYLTDGEYESIYDIVARSDFEIEIAGDPGETPVGNLTTDAMRLVTEEVTGEKVHVAFQTNGSIRQSIKPGAGGDISFYDISKAVGIGYGEDGYPGYPIVSFYLTGSEILRILEASAFLSEGISYTSFLQTSGLRYTYNPDNAIMFSIPFFDLPVPSINAVIDAEIYTGEGLQSNAADAENFEPIKKGELYHVVTGTSLMSYIQMAADILPWVMEPKNAQGEPLDLNNPEEYIICRDDGRELKLWETVVKHAAAQSPGDDGIAQIPDYYREASERIMPEWSFPAIIWLIIFLVILAALIVFLVRYRRRKKSEVATYAKQ